MNFQNCRRSSSEIRIACLYCYKVEWLGHVSGSRFPFWASIFVSAAAAPFEIWHCNTKSTNTYKQLFFRNILLFKQKIVILIQYTFFPPCIWLDSKEWRWKWILTSLIAKTYATLTGTDMTLRVVKYTVPATSVLTVLCSKQPNFRMLFYMLRIPACCSP